MEVIVTIIPIFVIILIGWVAQRRGLIPEEFLEQGNRLVYYISLPALIFNSIAKTRFHEQFDGLVLGLTLLAVTGIYLTADITARIVKMNPARIGTFVQSSGHANVGYIGLPVALYYLGEVGLARASIICAFLMILQNLLSVFTLQLHDVSAKTFLGVKAVTGKLLGNPVIIGAMAGIIVSVFAIPVPRVISKCFDILGEIAAPTALLIIGASLSLKLIQVYMRLALGAVFFKLLLLPTLGLLLFNLFHLSSDDYLPAMILLCSPTATVAYVMTREMHGDVDFIVATISATTLFSSITFMFWLALIAGISG